MGKSMRLIGEKLEKLLLLTIMVIAFLKAKSITFLPASSQWTLCPSSTLGFVLFFLISGSPGSSGESS